MKTKPAKKKRVKQNEKREICRPLMDALMIAADGGSTLALRTEYAQGIDLIVLCGDTMAKVNELCVANDRKGYA